MTSDQISGLRLQNEQLSQHQFKKVKELVHWMGAIQAQDFAMAKWAIGARIPGLEESDVNKAIDKGEIIRTHVLRPTWHFVMSEDLHWMTELTGKRILSAQGSRNKELELDEATFKKTRAIMEKQLAGNNHLTREELFPFFHKAKIPTDNNRGSHILFNAELRGIICSGAMKGNKTSYALIEERIQKKKELSREEALAELTERYFRSHGPATMADFCWWSGLSQTDAKKGIEMNKKDLREEQNNAKVYWHVANEKSKSSGRSLFLLPAYDEFIISYRDRSDSLPAEHTKQSISSNGMFYPTIVSNGQVIGLWKRQIVKDTVEIGVDLFPGAAKPSKTQLQQAAEKFGSFINKKVILE